MTQFISRKEHHEATFMVVIYLIILPICGFVFINLWELMLEVCCDQAEQRAQEVAPPTQRTIAIAPILTKLPPEFRFANYVDENGSESDDRTNSALSLASAINFQGFLAKCVPCPRCVRAGRKKRNQFEQIYTIPENEHRASASFHETNKMTNVANWLWMDKDVEPDTVRGSHLIFDLPSSSGTYKSTDSGQTLSDLESVDITQEKENRIEIKPAKPES